MDGKIADVNRSTGTIDASGRTAQQTPLDSAKNVSEQTGPECIGSMDAEWVVLSYDGNTDAIKTTLASWIQTQAARKLVNKKRPNEKRVVERKKNPSSRIVRATDSRESRMLPVPPIWHLYSPIVVNRWVILTLFINPTALFIAPNPRVEPSSIKSSISLSAKVASSPVIMLPFSFSPMGVGSISFILPDWAAFLTPAVFCALLIPISECWSSLVSKFLFLLREQKHHNHVVVLVAAQKLMACL